VTYNISKRAVQRMSAYLEAMYAGQRTMTWPSKEPEKLARRIREAMTAVQHHPQYERYIPLKILYVLHARSGFVEAEWVGTEEGVAQGVAAIPTIVQPLTLPDIYDLEGIVGAAIAYAAETDELTFPEAIISEEDKNTLYLWTIADGLWKFIDQDDAGITLTRKEVEAFLLWEPDDS
jgi:hypothetical protein